MEGLVVLLVIYVIVSIIAKVTTFITAARLGELEEMVRLLLARSEQPVKPAEPLIPPMRIVPPAPLKVEMPAVLKPVEEVNPVVEAKPDVAAREVVEEPDALVKVVSPSPLEKKGVEINLDVKAPEPEQKDFMELMWAKFEDWFCVRGTFAPKGMTREFAVATRWLVRVGIVMLVGSLIYFVKLSIEQGWMGPTARVAGMAVAGLTGVAGGVVLVRRTRYGLIGHALAALGTVALYFAFGLGHRFFDPPVIASAPVAFAALAGVTVLAGVLSVRLPSATLAVMGLVGGYLVPVVAGRDTGNPLPLCIYLVLLNSGAYVVAQLRRWEGLDALATAFAYLMMAIWCGRHPGASVGVMTTLLAFLALVHAAFVSRLAMNGAAQTNADASYRWGALSMNALVFLLWLGFVFRGVCHDVATGWVLVGLAGAYAALAWVARKRNWLDAVSASILGVFAVLFLALAPLLLCTQGWVGVSLSLLAIAVAEVSRRTRLAGMKTLSYLLVLASVFAVVLGNMSVYEVVPATAGDYFLTLVPRLIRLGILPVVFAVIGLRVGPEGQFLTGAGILAFLLLSCEARFLGLTFLPVAPGAVVTVAWAAVAFACLWSGLVRRMKALRFTGLGLLAVTVGKVLLVDTASFVVPARVAVFAVVGVLLIVGAFLYLKFKERFEEK